MTVWLPFFKSQLVKMQREQEIMGYLLSINTSLTQLPYLRLGRCHRRMGRKILRAKEQRSLLRDFVSYKWQKNYDTSTICSLKQYLNKDTHRQSHMNGVSYEPTPRQRITDHLTIWQQLRKGELVFLRRSSLLIIKCQVISNKIIHI